MLFCRPRLHCIEGDGLEFTRSLVFCVMVCTSLFLLLSCFLSAIVLSVLLRIRITTLVSSNSSHISLSEKYIKIVNVWKVSQQIGTFGNADRETRGGSSRVNIDNRQIQRRNSESKITHINHSPIYSMFKYFNQICRYLKFY